MSVKFYHLSSLSVILFDEGEDLGADEFRSGGHSPNLLRQVV